LCEQPGEDEGSWRSGLLTVDKDIIALQYAVYLLEAGLLGFVLLRRRQRRFIPIAIYLSLLLAIDGMSRPYVLYRYGFASRQYAYFFWLTDVLLVLAAFLLVCAFFRRACLQEKKMWHVLRPMLTFIFILVLGVSFFSLLQNYHNLFSRFIVEFQQNLYFTCLVLTTLLYILLQQRQSAEEELILLVTGMGIQFAGPAANFALVFLTPGQRFASNLYAYIGPLCALGMLLTWSYAVARLPEAVPMRARAGEVAEMAAAPRQA
jgi:hypothetical protein